MGGVSGVYSLRIDGLLLNAYCDIDEITGEAWLVIQRQSVGNVDFYRYLQSSPNSPKITKVQSTNQTLGIQLCPCTYRGENSDWFASRSLL